MLRDGHEERVAQVRDHELDEVAPLRGVVGRNQRGQCPRQRALGPKIRCRGGEADLRGEHAVDDPLVGAEQDAGLDARIVAHPVMGQAEVPGDEATRGIAGHRGGRERVGAARRVSPGIRIASAGAGIGGSPLVRSIWLLRPAPATCGQENRTTSPAAEQRGRVRCGGALRSGLCDGARHDVDLLGS